MISSVRAHGLASHVPWHDPIARHEQEAPYRHSRNTHADARHRAHLNPVWPDQVNPRLRHSRERQQHHR